MDSSDTVAMKPVRKLRIVETLLSIVIALLVGTVVLWNWDGFWQTNIPMLTSVQETYFPIKHAQEQDKLVNTRNNTVRWAEALNKIETLEAENAKLKDELKACKKRNPAKKSDRAY